MENGLSLKNRVGHQTDIFAMKSNAIAVRLTLLMVQLFEWENLYAVNIAQIGQEEPNALILNMDMPITKPDLNYIRFGFPCEAAATIPMTANIKITEVVESLFVLNGMTFQFFYLIWANLKKDKKLIA